jgi:hypothetical protein
MSPKTDHKTQSLEKHTTDTGLLKVEKEPPDCSLPNPDGTGEEFLNWEGKAPPALFYIFTS